MIKTITCHQKTASIDEMFGKEYISTSNLLRLSDISSSSFYKKFNEKRFKIAKYLYLNGRGRYNYITLDGSVEFLKMFNNPDDALIKTIESYIERQKTEKIEAEPDCFSSERKEVIDEVESLSSEHHEFEFTFWRTGFDLSKITVSNLFEMEDDFMEIEDE